MFIIYGVALLIIFTIFWYKVFTGRDELLECEQEKETIYSEKCGGRFDGFNYTIPLVRLAIYPDSLLLELLKSKVQMNA
jgi:hypothetical protein